jgi:hypothetical protein
MAHALTVFRRSEIMPATVRTPMIAATLLRACSPDEPGSGIPHAGIRERAVGRPASLP